MVMFPSVCHRYQCINHNSVCYDSGEWLLCEIWCIETTTEDHRHHLGLPVKSLLYEYTDYREDIY